MRNKHHIGRPKKPINKVICTNVKQLRLTSNMTMEQFIDTLELTQVRNEEPLEVNQYRQYEYGNRTIPDNMIEKICSYFKVSRNELFGIEEYSDTEIECANRKRELLAELLADKDTWNIYSFILHLGYEINDIDESLTIAMSKDNKLFHIPARNFYNSIEPIERFVIDTLTQKERE